MRIKLIVDSVSDIPKKICEELNIRVVPLSVNFSDGTYKDGIDLTTDQFFEKLAKSEKLPTTSQVNPGEFIEVFDEELKNYDHLIVMTLSSKMSGTYSAAVTAKEYLDVSNITVFDSKGVSFGYGIIAVEIAKMIQSGETLETINNRIEYCINNSVNLFILDTLDYLLKGGRLSAAEAFLGTLLKVKPILTMKDGSLTSLDKVRGRKKIEKWLLDYMDSHEIDLSGKSVGIFHALDSDFMNELINLMKLKYPSINIIESEVGTVVGTHSGPGAIGVSFVK